MSLLIPYLLLINIAAYIAMRHDKKQAQRHQHRVSERHLLTLAALGGAAATWLAMQQLRHKTRKNTFRLGIPALIILQLALLIAYKVTNPAL